MNRDFVTLLHACIDAHIGCCRGKSQTRQTPRGRQEAALRILGVQARLDGMAVARDCRLVQRQPLAGRDTQLPFDEVESGDHFGDRMLDLQARIHLEEIELGAIEQELDRAGAAITDCLGRRHRRGAHRGARRVVQAGRRGFLNDFLVAPLQRAVALVQVHGVAVRVGENLDLDMPALLDETLEQHSIIAEGPGSLAARTGESFGKFRCGADDAHALAAAARRWLDQQRVLQRVCRRKQICIGLVVIVVARQHGHAGGGHQAPCLALRTHAIDRGRGRTDENEAGRFAGTGEVGVLGKEAVPGMKRFAATLLRHGEQLVAVEVTFAGGGRADADGLVRHPHVQRSTVGFRIHGDGAQAQPPRRANDAAGDLAAVGNQDALEHGGSHILKMPNGVSPSSGRQVAAARARASTLRVSAGSITPSSQSRALAYVG